MTAKGMSSVGTAKLATIPPRKPGPPLRILLVDDEPDILQLNTEVLIRFGYHVDEAADGAAAWQALNTERYDLLITDHNMPKVSGVELLKKLHAARMALPAILVTSVPPTEELKLHPWLPITAMLLKPFAAEDLVGTVREILRA